MTDTKADDLVTEAMMDVAAAAFENSDATHDGTLDDGLRAALRAVAPMIAARAFEQCRHIPGLEGKFAWRVGARDEREACAKIAEQHGEASHDVGYFGVSNAAASIAAAIRARGETP
jgi:hypothetical protein